MTLTPDGWERHLRTLADYLAENKPARERLNRAETQRLAASLAAALSEIEELRGALKRIKDKARGNPIPERAPKSYGGGFNVGYGAAWKYAGEIARLALNPEGG